MSTDSPLSEKLHILDFPPEVTVSLFKALVRPVNGQDTSFGENGPGVAILEARQKCKDLLLLGAICSLWRYIVRTCPMLWTTLIFDTYISRLPALSQVEMITAFLPLSLSICAVPNADHVWPQPHSTTWEAHTRLAQALRPHIRRCGSFIVACCETASKVYFPLQGPLPYLRTLRCAAFPEGIEGHQESDVGIEQASLQAPMDGDVETSPLMPVQAENPPPLASVAIAVN